MIRRPATASDKSNRWVLISQIEHARLAGDLATAWGSETGPFLPLAGYAGLIDAIYHHDDGWAEWEKLPGVDSVSGKPRDFLEMPLDEALTIWRKSIDAASKFGPLSAYVVSRHFSTLLQRGMQSWKDDNRQKKVAAELFLREQELVEGEALANWRDKNPVLHTTEAAGVALAWLQFFDGLSLWLCCRERTAAQRMLPPGQPEVGFQPGESGLMVVDPWPFQPPQLSLEAAGRSVPDRFYASTLDLVREPGEPVLLRWRLVPRPPENRAAIS